jgi:hypothetical protein
MLKGSTRLFLVPDPTVVQQHRDVEKKMIVADDPGPEDQAVPTYGTRGLEL